MLDLRHPLAAGAKRQLGLVPRVFDKHLGNLLHRLHEIGGHRDQNLCRMGHAPAPPQQGGHHQGSDKEGFRCSHVAQRV